MASSDPAAPQESATDPSPSGSPDERVTASLGPDDGDAPGGAPVRVGDVLAGKYRIEGVIGTGGMGVVFAATHLHLHSKVALKVVRPDGEPHGASVERLLREARASARLAGEHVVRVMDAGTLETGAPYIVMEHLQGRDLGAELRARGPFSIEDAVEALLHACEAVAEAHAAGIVHRDLKPSNLFLTRRSDGSPCVKVLDFGIAKALERGEGSEPGERGEDAALTSSRSVLGSPMYMSPEQIRSARTVDPRTDVWSLGLILFELLTGSRPFQGDSAASRLAATAADPALPLRVLRPDAPAELEALILGCLEKDVDRRTPSVAALARGLAPFAPPRAAGSVERVQASLRAPPVLREDDVRPRVSRRRGGWVIGALVAALCAGGAVAYGMRSGRFAPALDAAAATGSRQAAQRRSVAVLGFRDLSGKPESAWLSTALVEMFGTELSIGERLRIVPGEDVARAARDRGVTDAEGLASDPEARRALGAEVLVHGSYLMIGEGDHRKLRLDVRIEGASPGGAPVSIAETGSEAELFDLVARVGARLRDALGIGALSAREEDSVRAARPATAEAARLYAEGLSKLRLRDAQGARRSRSRRRPRPTRPSRSPTRPWRRRGSTWAGWSRPRPRPSGPSISPRACRAKSASSSRGATASP